MTVYHKKALHNAPAPYSSLSTALFSSSFSSIFSFALFTREDIGPFIFSCGSVLCSVSGSGWDMGLSCSFFSGCICLLSSFAIKYVFEYQLYRKKLCHPPPALSRIIILLNNYL